MSVEFRPRPRRRTLRLVLAAVLALVALVVPVGFAAITLGIGPIGYTIGNGVLEVRSGELLWGKRAVKLADITETRVVTLRGGRRTLGTALPGHCAGSFRYDGIGPVWQATDCSSFALLVRARGGGEPLLLTPPRADDFVARLARGEDTVVTLPERPAGKQLGFNAGAALVAGALVTSLVIVLAVWGPGRMRYSVEEGALHVRTMFAHKTFRGPEIRARRHRPAGMSRVAGTALPGYYTGLFRESGESTRVFATTLEEGVLVEGPIRLFLSPDDADGLLAALRAAGATVE
jgi:hypothetical protein